MLKNKLLNTILKPFNFSIINKNKYSSLLNQISNLKNDTISEEMIFKLCELILDIKENPKYSFDTLDRSEKINLCMDLLCRANKLKKPLNSNANVNLIQESQGIFVLLEDIGFIFPPHDKFQLPKHIKKGDYQRKAFRKIIKYLREKNLFIDNSIFLDIGANIGTHTVYALKEPEISSAFAIEPSSSNLVFLRYNLKVNDCEASAQIVPVALGDFNGNVTLCKNPVHCGDNRIMARKQVNDVRNLFNEGAFKKEVVKISTFDTFLKTNTVNLDKIALVWIDTQGSEGLILHPSRLIKESSCPIYIEFWPYGMQKLDSYKPLRNFILEEVKSIVQFTHDVPIVYSPTEIDKIYDKFSKNAYSFCDLLLLR